MKRLIIFFAILIKSSAIYANFQKPLANASNCEKPVYPKESRLAQEEGSVQLRFIVETNGQATNVTISQSSGYARLDEAAKDALLKCQFKPAVRNGVPIADWAAMKFTWRLDPPIRPIDNNKQNLNSSDFEQPNKVTSAIAPKSKVYALVIGNSNYPNSSKLSNPINDANAISQKFRTFGFDVTEILDATQEKLISSLSNFRQKSLSADMTLLFYAGHGIQISGTNYMLPIDLDMSDISQAPLKGISLSLVIDQYLPGKTKLVFLDACRDNPLMQSNNRGVSRGLAPITASEGTLISYSTRDGQLAQDGFGKNSPFTKALLNHLDAPDDIAVVLRKVREQVMRETDNKQQPWEYGSLTGGALVLSSGKQQ